MEEKDIKTELLMEIDNMYIVSVFQGRYTGPGSFVAIDEDGNEFFASKELVRKKSELIKILSDRIRPLWVLVKDEIWGGKWENKRVSEILVISENGKECEDYKSKLTERLQFRVDLMDLHEQHLELIDGSFLISSFHEKEEQLEREIAVLQEKLIKLNTLLDDHE